MTLFINTGNSQNKNWKGYDYVLNRVAPENGKAVLENTTARAGQDLQP